MKRLRDRPLSSAKENAIPTSAIGSTVEQTFSSECQTGNVPSCSVVTKAARSGCTPKKMTLSERQGPGRERRPKWRLLQGSKLSVCMQNDRIFASLVECVLRRSFSEHWRKNGMDRLRDRPLSSAKEKAIPTSAIGSTVEQTFSSECQTGNVPSCSVVTKAARSGCTPKKMTLSERQGPGRERRPKWRLLQGSKLSVCMQNDRTFASLVECVLRRSFSEHWRKNGMDRLRDRPLSSAKEKAIPTSAIGSTVEQTFSSECQTGNVPSCSVVTKAARSGCTPKKMTLSERQGPGRGRRPKWRLLQGSKLTVCMQNDRIFASLVECVLRRSFSEHWRKNGLDPRPTTYHSMQSRRPTRQGQTVDLLSVRGPKKKAEMLVGALPERVEPRN